MAIGVDAVHEHLLSSASHPRGNGAGLEIQVLHAVGAHEGPLGRRRHLWIDVGAPRRRSCRKLPLQAGSDLAQEAIPWVEQPQPVAAVGANQVMYEVDAFVRVGGYIKLAGAVNDPVDSRRHIDDMDSL